MERHECEVCYAKTAQAVGNPPAYLCGVHRNQLKHRVGPITYHTTAWTRPMVRQALGFVFPEAPAAGGRKG